MIMFLSKNWNFNKMSPKYPLESLENRARRGKIYMYLLKKCETKAEDQWRRANTGIVCVFQCIPHQCQASKSGFLAEFLTVPSCSKQKFQAVSQPDLGDAGFGNEECQVASQALYVCFCNCRNAWMFKPGKQYGSNIPQDHWKTKPSTSAERERSIEKYREVLWLLCHYYAITMRYCGYLMLRLEWHGMTTWLQQHIVAPWHELLLSGDRALAFWNSAESAKSLSLQTFCITPK